MSAAERKEIERLQNECDLRREEFERTIKAAQAFRDGSAEREKALVREIERLKGDLSILRLQYRAAEEGLAARLGKYLASGEWGMVHQVIHKLTALAGHALDEEVKRGIKLALDQIEVMAEGDITGGGPVEGAHHRAIEKYRKAEGLQ